MPYNNDESLVLIHHGIIGQKWGIRRYQNKDGTLTEAGKRRLAKNALKRDGGEFQKEQTEFNKQVIIGKGDYKTAMDHMESFTDQELDILINRHRKDVTMKEFAEKEKRRWTDGVKKTTESLKVIGDFAMAGTNMYNVIAKGVNTFTSADLPIIGEKKNRGVDSDTSVRYEDIPGNSDYIKKITTVTTKNSDGTTSHKNDVEWVSKQNKNNNNATTRSDIRYEEVPGNDRFLKKITTETKKNSDGTTSSVDNTEWIAKSKIFNANEGNGNDNGGKKKQPKNTDDNQNQPKQSNQPKQPKNSGESDFSRYYTPSDFEKYYKNQPSGKAAGVKSQKWEVRPKTNADGSWKDHEYIDRKKVGDHYEYVYESDADDYKPRHLKIGPETSVPDRNSKKVKAGKSFWESFSNYDPYNYKSMW